MRGRRWQKGRLHALNSAVTPPPSQQQLPVTHGWWQPPSCRYHSSPQSHQGLILSSDAERRIQLAHRRVCVWVRVHLIGYVTPCWGKSLLKCLIVCLQFDKQAFSRKVCRSFRHAAGGRLAYGLANRYTVVNCSCLRKISMQHRILMKSCVVSWL